MIAPLLPVRLVAIEPAVDVDTVLVLAHLVPISRVGWLPIGPALIRRDFRPVDPDECTLGRAIAGYREGDAIIIAREDALESTHLKPSQHRSA